MEKVTVNAKSPTVEEVQKEISSLRIELDEARKDRDLYLSLYNSLSKDLKKKERLLGAVKSILDLD